MKRHHRRLHYRIRFRKGMGNIELAITAVIGVIFTCVAIDLGVMMLGNQVLDRATRDAARAAAGQSSSAAAKQAALAALASHTTDGAIISQPQLDDSQFKYEDYGGTPAGQVNPTTNVTAEEPYVEVVASTEVRLPANITWLGGLLSLKDGPLATGKMPFFRKYHFQIVRAPLSNEFGGNQ